MNRILARFLLWFFIAALPVQGMAAAMRSCCAAVSAMQAGQGKLVAAAAAAATTVAMTRGDAAHADHDHHSDHAVTSRAEHCAAMAEPVHAGCDMPQSAKHDAGACSACAACCFSAPPTMPTSIAFVPLTLSSAKITLVSLPLMAGHIPSGLERPPRLFLV